jgi:hypothetical protein
MGNGKMMENDLALDHGEVKENLERDGKMVSSDVS